MMRLAIALLALCAAGPATAHTGGAGWHVDPWALALLAIAASIYAVGLARLWGHAGAGRGVPVWRVLCAAAGLLWMCALLLSPLDAAAGRLLSAHMVQHFALMLIAAPLLVLGRPVPVMLWAFPRAARRALGRAGRGTAGAVWRTLTTPLGAWAVYFATLWFWHIPAVHQRAIASDGLHAVQHASFLAAALIFWTAVVERPRAAALLAVFATAVQSCALAALLTVSQSLWYPAYTGAAGLTPMQDQQLAGLIMWVPCCVVMIGAGLVVLFRLLRDVEARADRSWT